MKRMSLIIPLLLIIMSAGPAPAEIHVEKDEYGALFQAYGVEGSFVLYDLGNDVYIRYNSYRCQKGFLPGSTFKIYNTLIGLETGVASGKNFVIKWDGEDRGIKSWNRDQTLETAFKNSVVWYYEELAGRIGPERMKTHLEAIPYGNCDISTEKEPFWLEGDLRISQDEQVQLLKRLYLGDLPFSKQHVSLVKRLMFLEGTPEYTIRGKSGWVNFNRPKEKNIGWFVGYVEQNNNVYIFATNIETDDRRNDFSAARYEITKKILLDLGLTGSSKDVSYWLKPRNLDQAVAAQPVKERRKPMMKHKKTIPPHYQVSLLGD